MKVEINRFALDRIPISLIIDDSTVLVNLNYFFIRDRNIATGSNQRWEDIPVVHPEFFTREFAEWCLENGVKGKFSVVPCPAALGRIDQGLPLFSKAQQESWLKMCRELICPSFDITPEMITHTFVVDLKTFQPLESRIWEQYEWARLPIDQEELIIDYISTACQILKNVGLTPEGVTSPGGFGGHPLDFYAKVVGIAVRQVTGNPTPYFFKRFASGNVVETPVWYPDKTSGTAVGEIIASTDDWTGSWTGYDMVSVDKYITADLQGGRIPELINAGEPAILCSHWQGFYGMHNDDRRGFNTLKAVVRRIKELDPKGERICWRKCSEITNYACARELATISVESLESEHSSTNGYKITLDLPVLVREFTLKVSDVNVAEVLLDDIPLRRVSNRTEFKSGTFLVETYKTLIAFDPSKHRHVLHIKVLN